MQKRLILASASPRRRELLSIAGYEFEIMASDAEEITDNMSAAFLAEFNAIEKANDIAKQVEDAVVVGADTVVCLDGEILGKPKDEADALRMLKKLSGRRHSVITGYAVVHDGKEERGYCESYVHFRELSDVEINAYVATGEPLDKAGSYGIQERASLFVSYIEGDYFNVMGLPVASLYPILKKHGVYPQWQNVDL